jgi:hypothetical protein
MTSFVSDYSLYPDHVIVVGMTELRTDQMEDKYARRKYHAGFGQD